MKTFIKKYWNYILVFFVPWVLIVIHSIVRSSWPFADGSLLNGDTGLQLYPLMVELWEKVHSGESLFFSWNAGNGIDFYLNMVYYLISPFNLIVLLLPKACIEDAVQFVMVFKWSLMGLTTTYYFMHTKYNKLKWNKKAFSAALGLAFVLSNAILTIFGYFNWGDVIIIFPLLLLALEHLMEDGKWKSYFILLTISMLCNFYMTYQVCIFLVFWFLIHLDKTIEKKRQKFLLFAGSSILSAITSGIAILPAALGATNRYNSGGIASWINSIFTIGEKLFLFSDGLVDWQSYKPNIYFSIGFFIFVVLFFVIKMNFKEKGKVCLVWLFMMLSLCSGILTVFWHGFSVPYGVNHRFLFLLVFLMLYMAMDTMIYMETITKWKLLLSAILELVFMVLCFFHISGFSDFYGYLITFLLLILYNLLIYLYMKGSIKYQNIIITISVIIMVELGANAIYELKEYNIKSWDAVLYNKEAEALADNIILDEGERADFSDAPNNFGLSVNLPGTNQFVSYNSNQMIALYNNLGMDFSESSSYLLSGSSPLTNLMFNIRYGISDWEGEYSDTDLIDKSDKLNVYRIKRLAGLGYMVDEDVVNWNTEDLVNFDLQNDFIKKSVGGDDIFTNVMPKERFTDGVLSYQYDEDNYKKGYYYYDYVSKSVAATEMTEFSFTVEEDMDLYLDVFSQHTMTNIIYVDEKEVCRDSALRIQNYYHIGNVKKGQKVIVYSIHSMGVGEEATLWFRFAKFNEENYAKAYEKLSKNVYEIEEMDSTYVSGTIHADEDGIMMTSIPAMNGFSIYVDGEQTEFEKIGDAFIGVPLTAGDHKVEFKYITPYFIPGFIGSMIGVVIFALICLFGRKKKDDILRNEESENEEPEKMIEG